MTNVMSARNANVRRRKRLLKYLEAVSWTRLVRKNAGWDPSNRQQVMRQQNRISSILPNTVSRLCGDLEEIFGRPKILKLNVLTIRDVRKLFQLLKY